jgi:ABC-type glycerol-3-phosphate transport system permease component
MAELTVGPRRGNTIGRVGLGKVCIHLVLLAFGLVTVFPLLWMLSTALKGPQEIFTPDLRLAPAAPTWDNFPEAFRLQPVGRWFVNSVVIAGTIAAGQMLVSLPAAYAFARLRFRGRGLLFGLVVGTMVVPYVTTIVPNYVLIARLDWLDTRQGVIVPSLAFTGYNIFLLRQALLALPRDLFDAARIDGAGPWTMLRQIALPLVRPSVAAGAVVSFLWASNLYLWPLLVLTSDESKTLAVGLPRFIAQQGGEQQWGPMMAMAVIATVPPLILYVLAQRAIISAFVTSGLKA